MLGTSGSRIGGTELSILEKLLAPYAAATSGQATPLDYLQQDPVYGTLFPSVSGVPNDKTGQGRAGIGGKVDVSGLEEIIFGGNRLNPSSADPSHPSHLHAGGNNILPLLRWIDNLPGFEVGENKHFGGVAPVHTDNSWHYRNRKGQVRADKQGVGAGDINYVGGGRFKNENRALTWLERILLGM